MNTDSNNLLLIVADDLRRTKRLSSRLRAAGYRIRESETLASVWRVMNDETPFATMIYAFPNGSFSEPWDLCTELARSTRSTIMLLIARGNRRTRALAFLNHVDQCFSLPNCSTEIIAYLDAHRRRSQQLAEATHPSGEPEPMLEMDLRNRRIYRQGQAIDLTSQECTLLRLLARHEGQVVCHEELRANLWQSLEEHVAQANLKQCILRLRRKIEANPHYPQYLRTVPGLGYRLQLHHVSKLDKCGIKYSE